MLFFRIIGLLLLVSDDILGLGIEEEEGVKGKERIIFPSL